MATVTKVKTVQYSGGSSGASAIIGYESSKTRVFVIQFTVDAPVTTLWVNLDAEVWNVGSNDLYIYGKVGTNATEYSNHYGHDGTLIGFLRKGSKSKDEASDMQAPITGLNLQPGVTYYLSLYPGNAAYSCIYVGASYITLSAPTPTIQLKSVEYPEINTSITRECRPNQPYTDFPMAKRTGYHSSTWYADLGADGPINLGIYYKELEAYMFDAYMSSWTSIKNSVLLSCTQSGGWNLWFNSSGVLIVEYRTSGSSYTTLTTSITGSTLVAGWHSFEFTQIDGTVTVKVDGTIVGTKAMALYECHGNNTMWLGAEASSNATSHENNLFTGRIRNFRCGDRTILNAAAGWELPPCGLTLYAEWEPNVVNIVYNPGIAIITNTTYGTVPEGWISKNGTLMVDTIKSTNQYTPQSKTTFGLDRAGYDYDNNWLVNNASNNKVASGTAYNANVFVGVNGETTDTHTDFYCHLFASPGTLQNYVIDFYSDDEWLFDHYVEYGNSAYDEWPIPTSDGKKFKGWYIDVERNGPVNLGLDYRYTSGLNVSFEAYRHDWTSWNEKEAFISCTNDGGWNLFAENNGMLSSDIMDAGTGTYQTPHGMYDLKTLKSGWHKFDFIFSNTDKKIRYYIDDKLIATSVDFIDDIQLNKKCSLYLGSEAVSYDTYDSAQNFQGLIKNVKIYNNPSWTDTPVGIFPIPAHGIELYADWESFANAYVKVAGRWMLGTIALKLGGKWIGIEESGDNTPTAIITNLGSYGFYRDSDGYYTSGNAGFNNTAACCKVDLTLHEQQEVIVEYYQSSEIHWDYGVVSQLNMELIPSASQSDYNSVALLLKGYEDYGEYSYGTLDPGTYTIYIKYRKDGSVARGSDILKFKLKNISITGEENYIPPTDCSGSYVECDCYDCDCDCWDCDCDCYECDCDCWDCDCDCYECDCNYCNDCWDPIECYMECEMYPTMECGYECECLYECEWPIDCDFGDGDCTIDCECGLYECDCYWVDCDSECDYVECYFNPVDCWIPYE